MRLLLNTKHLCRKHRFYVIGLLLSNSISFTAGAQEHTRKNLIGVGTTLQLTTHYGLNPVFNVNYEHRFTTHSSFETGLRFNRYKYSVGVTSEDGAPRTYYDRLNLFSVPLLYKYRSNIVNVAAGPSLNLMTGEQMDLPVFGRYEFGKPLKKLALGYQVKVSKTFVLTDRLVLEPEVSVLGDQYFKKPKGEVGVGFKYKF